MENNLCYAGQSALQIHARSLILLRSEMVREAVVKIWAQRNLWRIGNVQIVRKSKKKLSGTFYGISADAYTFKIPFCFYFCALAFKHTGHIHLLHIIIQIKDEVHVFPFYKSYILPTQILHRIEEKTDKNKAFFKQKMREL